MTHTLILMRHAKSSWDSAGMDDHARPLNARGRASADALGDWLRDQSLIPDEVLCSSAARTRETCARLQLQTKVQTSDALYLAEPAAMLASLKSATGRTVLMIGHNPGIAAFAARMVTRPPEHTRFFDYPTGATLVVSFDIAGWDALSSGRATQFVVPRDLIA